MPTISTINTTYPVSQFHQTIQEGGIWVLTLTLDKKESQTHIKPIELGGRLIIDDLDMATHLFQQTITANHTQLQLFSHHAIPASHTVKTVTYTPPQTSPPIASNTHTLLIGSGLEMGNLFYLAKQRASNQTNSRTLALLHSEQAFPFKVKPARFIVQGLPPEAIGACPLLEDWKITNRLASNTFTPGCFEGSIESFYQAWLFQQNQLTAQTNLKETWQVIMCAPLSAQKKCREVSQSYSWINFIGI